VLYVSPHAHLGGAERVTIDLVALHSRQEVEPSVCFLRDGPLVSRCRDRLGVPTYVVPAPPLRSLMAAGRAVRTIADLVRAGDIDLVHSSMSWGHCYGGRAARRAGRPAVWFQHVGASWRSALEAAASLIRARTIIANSEYTAAGQRRVNPRRVPVAVIHPGTRIPEEPRARRRARGRTALGLAEGEFAVGIAARLQPWKGQDVFLRAAASLCHARAHARAFVIGEALFGLDSEWAGRLPALAESLGIRDRVSFTGFRDDVPDCLAAMDVVVHASVTPEPFGLAIVEAMAAGTTVVASDAGGAREIVTPGTDGLLTPPGDHEALATALLHLCDDPEFRDALAAAGERTAYQRFDALEMTLKVEELYRSLVRR
jgi:glycosyltransferase involved in cell wall biosynthesis